MRVAVTGGRDYENWKQLFDALDAIHDVTPISLIIEGGQRKWDRERNCYVGGADYWAFKWGGSRHIRVQTVKADWSTFGLAAGPLRNGLMVRDLHPDLVVATPGGKGTRNMMEQSLKAGVRVIKLQ